MLQFEGSIFEFGLIESFVTIWCISTICVVGQSVCLSISLLVDFCANVTLSLSNGNLYLPFFLPSGDGNDSSDSSDSCDSNDQKTLFTKTILHQKSVFTKLPLYQNTCSPKIVSRPGRCQGLLYKQPRHWLIDLLIYWFSQWAISSHSFTTPPRPNGWR